MVDFETWLHGAWLAAWGCALLLAYVSLQRLVNLAHVVGYQRGYLPRPYKVWPPVHRQRDVWTALTGLALAAGALVASNVSAGELLGTPRFDNGPLGEIVGGLIRAHVAVLVLLFFLRQIAETPNFKLNWVVAWYAFSVGLAFWG